MMARCKTGFVLVCGSQFMSAAPSKTIYLHKTSTIGENVPAFLTLLSKSLPFTCLMMSGGLGSARGGAEYDRNDYSSAVDPEIILDVPTLKPIKFNAPDVYGLHDLVCMLRERYPDKYFVILSFMDASKPGAPLDVFFNQASAICTGKICHVEITNMQNETFGVFRPGGDASRSSQTSSTAPPPNEGGVRRLLNKAFSKPYHHFYLLTDSEKNYAHCMEYLNDQLGEPYSLGRAIQAISRFIWIPFSTGHTCATLVREALYTLFPTGLPKGETYQRLESPQLMFMELHNNRFFHEKVGRVLLVPSKITPGSRYR